MKMEEYIERVQREEEETRVQLNEEHEADKVQRRSDITKLKFELDKVLSLKVQI